MVTMENVYMNDKLKVLSYIKKLSPAQAKGGLR